MSNLVTPMMTSVDNSPTVDFYPNAMRFSSPRSIMPEADDESNEWTNLGPFVGHTTLFKTSTPHKTHSILGSRRMFNTICSEVVSLNEKDCVIQEASKTTHNIWQATHTDNNSCSKTCVNINMGYNDGSSLESMVSNKKVKSKPDLLLSKPAVECNSGTKPIEYTSAKIVESNPSKTIMSPPVLLKDTDRIKTFKNGSKTGHSRQWGSCGSAVTLQLNFDDKSVKSKFSLDLNPSNNVISSTDEVVQPQVTTATEIRNKSYSQNNRMKRISQLSFEAEFDSEGRTHEQITIDFRKFEPYIMSGQITQIELSYFKAVKSEEFLSFKWTGLSKHIHAPGIVASTRWFNQLSFWAQRIVLECSEMNRRTEMLAYLIRIIKKLVDTFNNLSSGMALMSALEVECIHRLKQTWNNLSSKDRTIFRRMQELFSSDNNYEKLRDHINSLKLPCIPYLGLYLTDLTYINIAHSKLSEFESQTKTDQINNILRTVSEFQQSEYEIIQNPLLYRYLESQRYIEELQKIIEENNYRTSMFLEPNPSTESVSQPSRQQSDFPTYNTISPQKTPPSYACKHLPLKIEPSLQSPISPKPMSSHNESIKEVPEQHPDTQVMLTVDQCTPTNEDCDPTNVINNVIPIEVVPTNTVDTVKGGLPYEESLMLSSRYSDEDSVRVSLLCGAGRKSYFKKRSTSTSIRFKRDSSSSSRQQASSKTATLSSTSQSGVSDKDLLAGQHSKSLLDDSYLDATLTETCSGTTALDTIGQGLSHGDISAASKIQNEMLCSPPICRCLIKGDTVDLKPKASTKRKTPYSNLVSIALAAETAAQMKKKDSFYDPRDFDNDLEGNIETPTNVTSDKDILKLVCQGVLSRQSCVKNAKRSRFSMWNRYWMVLMISKQNAFLVFFENNQFHAIEKKDFKSKKCHVQDLKRVKVSRVRPSINKNISEQTEELSSNSDDNDLNHSIKKFFLVDKEYGLVYKFRDPSSSKSKPHSKEKKSVSDTEHEQCLQESPCNDQMPSVNSWYKLLRRCIKKINRPTDEHKDLIVLGDS